MNDTLLLGIKAFNGGTFVVAFALIAEVLQPKRFAGLFSAAPSIALATLIVVIASKGHADAVASTRGMVLGAFAFGLSCLAGVVLVGGTGPCAPRWPLPSCGSASPSPASWSS